MDISYLTALQDKVIEKLASYDHFVRLNPRVATEIEAIIRWTSYLVATRKSPVMGEMLSTAANLLQLCNDVILRQSNPKLGLDFSRWGPKLRTFLSVLQSLELLAEVYVRDNHGEAAKWAIIAVIQLTKASIKLILLLVFDEGMSRSQSFVPLDRAHYSEILKLEKELKDNPNVHDTDLDPSDSPSSSGLQVSKSSIVLKSSGRKMRSISEAPPKGSRFTNETATKKPLSQVQKERLKLLISRYCEQSPNRLNKEQLRGELLYILKPIAHLVLMRGFGIQSWIPYIAAVVLDVSSLQLIRNIGRSDQSSSSGTVEVPTMRFNSNERIELGKRASSLLMYMLRSPFFDQFIKERALDGLSSTAERIPFLGHILATFVNYIPDWQKDYFRVWND